MSSGADASEALYAPLARLSGPDLVAHLSATCRKADYPAAARVLGDRDRRLAHAEAAAAEVRTELADLAAQVQDLEERYLALKAELRGPSNGCASSGGAITIAAAAPRVGRRAEEPGPEGVIDLCGSSDDDDEMEEGEFRPATAGLSCKRKESASGSDEGRPAGVSCKRNAPASACSPDDEDDEVPLSQLFKKQRRADPWANGEPKKGHGDVLASSAGPLGVHRPVISQVNRGIHEAVTEHMIGSPDDGPNVAVLVQGTGNGQSVKNGGLSRTMPSPPPTGSTAGNSPHKNGSKPDGSEGRTRIGEKQGPAAGPENDAPLQVRTPSLVDTVRRIVGSLRVGAETPIGSSSEGTISLVAKSIKGQEKAIGGVQKTKVSLETNGTGDKASMAMRGTSTEQGKPDGQVVKTKVLPTTNGVGERWGKPSPCQSRDDTHGGGRPTTSDKPVSATLQPQNQLAQMSKDSSLPSAVYNWKSSSELLVSCLGNKELCMQAACALYRQRKFTTEGGRSGLSKFDAHRAAVLVEFLLDGNLQGPLKRTAEDLEKHDSAGHDLLERVVLHCSEQLFGLYSNKEDKCFLPLKVTKL